MAFGDEKTAQPLDWLAEDRQHRQTVAEEEWHRSEKKLKIRRWIAVAILPVLAIGIGAFLTAVRVVIPAMQYDKATEALSNGRYEEAYVGYKKIGDYKDSAVQAAQLLAAHPTVAQLGDILSFGSYEQDGQKENGKEPIEWAVLGRDGDTAMLISRYCLDSHVYHKDYVDITWEKSSIREWLNKDFLNAAFTWEQQQLLLSTPVLNESNEEYEIGGGKKTVDKVFCLSIEEARRYYVGDEDRLGALTPALESTGKVAAPRGNGRWWLRSPGSGGAFAAFVEVSGEIVPFGEYVNSDAIAVRPVICIDLNEIQ